MGNVPTSKVKGIQFHNFVDASALRKDFPAIAAIRDNRFKLVEPAPGKFELYDILNDPSESIDLVSNFPDTAQELIKQLRQWQADVSQSNTGADYNSRN
jgi:hypothetical protein